MRIRRGPRATKRERGATNICRQACYSARYSARMRKVPTTRASKLQQQRAWGKCQRLYVRERGGVCLEEATGRLRHKIALGTRRMVVYMCRVGGMQVCRYAGIKRALGTRRIVARLATRQRRECQACAQHGIEVCAQHADLFEQTKCSAEHFLQHPPAGLLAKSKEVTRGIAICGASCAAIPLTAPPIATVLDNARHHHEQGGAEQDGGTGGQRGGVGAS